MGHIGQSAQQELSERYRRISLFRQLIPGNIHAEQEALVDATLARDTTTSILSERILRTLDAVKQMPRDFFSRARAVVVRAVSPAPETEG